MNTSSSAGNISSSTLHRHPKEESTGPSSESEPTATTSDEEVLDERDGIEVDLSQLYLETFPVEYFQGRRARYPRSVHKRVAQMSLAQNRLLHFPAAVVKFSNLIRFENFTVP